ncbi:hypothetical protein [Legionella fallonii]|uniref:hypothetical protein n=1 Tax=Legionella fallonii TaxID=96230 RepID=UPI00155A2B24|nr:hypothetical protein [Legionella fallonii]
MNKILQAYYESALTLKLPVTYVNEINSLHICFGKENYYLLRGITHLNNASSIFIANNKHATKLLFEQEGISVPKAVTINKRKLQKYSLSNLIKKLRFPLVIKPMLNSHSGMDVVCNIKTYDDLSFQLEKALQTSSDILVEEYHEGLKEYRVLLLKNRIIGVVERFAPIIEGDGQLTIEQLMTQNEEFPQINDDCQNCLTDQGLSLDSIPHKGQVVRVRYAVNRALGGQVAFVNKKINRENAKYIRKAAQITGLDLVGLDLMCEHINHPFSKTKWFILEANFPPDITLHELPDDGKGIKIGKKVLIQLILRHPFAYLYHRLKNIMSPTRGDSNG